MKRIIIVLSLGFFLNNGLFSQQNDLIRVKAGTRLSEYFPISVRYYYPEFASGQLFLKTGNFSSGKFNYNLLSGAMDYLAGTDTLAISNTKDISYIAFSRDTFYYDNGYIELVRGGPVMVGLLKQIKLQSIERKGAMGMTDRNSAIDTYNSISFTGKFYEIIPNEDWVFKTESDYYISTPGKGFMQYTRNNVMQIFPENKDLIKDYLKSNRISFNSKEDLIRLAGFLEGFLSKSP